VINIINKSLDAEEPLSTFRFIIKSPVNIVWIVSMDLVET